MLKEWKCDDLIHFGDLSRESRKAIGHWYAENDWEDLDYGERTWLMLETITLLFFRLRLAEDTPNLFPRGKWATIQALEQLIESSLTKGDEGSDS